MNRMSLRPILAPLAGAAICFLAGPWTGLTGLAERNQFIEVLDGRAVSVTSTDDAGPISIYVERWSTDAEFQALRAPLLPGGADTLLEALGPPAARIGVVLMPGLQNHGARSRIRTPKNVLFAREVNTPAGRRVIVASDEYLGLGESPLAAKKDRNEFSLLDIRFGPDGVGVGKLATASDVGYDPVTGCLELKAFGSQPARLIGVKSNRF